MYEGLHLYWCVCVSARANVCRCVCVNMCFRKYVGRLQHTAKHCNTLQHEDGKQGWGCVIRYIILRNFLPYCTVSFSPRPPSCIPPRPEKIAAATFCIYHFSPPSPTRHFFSFHPPPPPSSQRK